MAAEVPISLFKFHSTHHAVAALFVISHLSLCQLKMIFTISDQLKNVVELITLTFLLLEKIK